MGKTIDVLVVFDIVYSLIYYCNERKYFTKKSLGNTFFNFMY